MDDSNEEIVGKKVKRTYNSIVWIKKSKEEKNKIDVERKKKKREQKTQNKIDAGMINLKKEIEKLKEQNEMNLKLACVEFGKIIRDKLSWQDFKFQEFWIEIAFNKIPFIFFCF